MKWMFHLRRNFVTEKHRYRVNGDGQLLHTVRENTLRSFAVSKNIGSGAI